MSDVFETRGTAVQQEIARQAINSCDFPFDWLRDGLAKEGKRTIVIDWQDLSRARQIMRSHGGEEHSHITIDGAVAHPIEREVDGRRQVYGLFYLPPHTQIVIDSGLVSDPMLAMEVVLAEAAHAVDYHFLTPDHRRSITNILHDDDLPPDHPVNDGAAFELDGHTCSWFDVGPYSMWVGEAFMETFIEAFSPDIPSTLSLDHPTGDEQSAAVRDLLLGEKIDHLRYVGSKGGRVYHIEGCPALRFARSRVEFGSVPPTNRRPCRRCLAGPR